MNKVLDEKHYDRLLKARSDISSISWTVFSIFGASLAILGNGVAQTQNATAAKMLSGIGLAASVMWLAIQNRLHGYVVFYRLLIYRAEESLEIDQAFRLSQTPKSPGAREFRYSLRASSVATFGIVVAILLWGATLFQQFTGLLVR